MNDRRTRKPPLIGQSNFRGFRKADAYYMDKSLMIQDVIECSFQVILIPRRRRFGKTLNLSMLRYFFEQSNESQAALFDGLTIRDYEGFDEHHGQYPVIFLTLKDVKSHRWDECFSKLQHFVYKVFLNHRYLLSTMFFFLRRKNVFKKSSKASE